MKKLFSLILIVVLGVSTIATGCGEKPMNKKIATEKTNKKVAKTVERKSAERVVGENKTDDKKVEDKKSGKKTNNKSDNKKSNTTVSSKTQSTTTNTVAPVAKPNTPAPAPTPVAKPANPEPCCHSNEYVCETYAIVYCGCGKPLGGKNQNLTDEGMHHTTRCSGWNYVATYGIYKCPDCGHIHDDGAGLW